MTTDRLGEAYTIELKPNGSSIAVSRSNVIEYIHLVADYKINRYVVGGFSPQIDLLL